MRKKGKVTVFIFLLILVLLCVESKKISKSRSSSSGRSSNRKNNNPQPSPTSHSYPQTANKPTLFGWQEKPAQRTQSRPSQSHSYPSSNTGLSGNPGRQSPYQENVQKSNTYSQNSGRSSYPAQTQQGTANQQSVHSYPASNGMSGQSGTGVGYPSQQGSALSGNAPKQPPSYQESMQKSQYPQSNQAQAYPASPGLSGNTGTGVGYPSHQAPPPAYSGGHYSNSGSAYGAQNYGNNYRSPPQGPPPPYPGNFGSNYGGYNHGYASQMPGYFGNYGGSGKGFGGMSRTGNTLTGVGIAGAGIGTVLTGLALWNLARSTGHRHHTVIYDNRGQPVAVAPADNSSAAVDPILADLVNCTLTISNINATEVLAIPCNIATSFTPEADVKETSDIKANDKESTKCTITIITKAGREFMTTIPCSILLNTAAENNVTEPPPTVNNSPNEFDFKNETILANPLPPHPANSPLLSSDPKNNNDLSNCSSLESGVTRDPLNPCFAITHDVTVLPLLKTEISTPQPGSKK